jgi:hypothetical protein
MENLAARVALHVIADIIRVDGDSPDSWLTGCLIEKRCRSTDEIP